MTAEAFGAREDDEEDLGAAIPAPTALLGVAFAACAVMLAGLPPLAGFVGKFAMLHALLESDAVSATSWTMIAMLILSGFATIVAMARAGVRRFWGSAETSAPRVRVVEFAPVVFLLALCAALTVQANALAQYFDATAQALRVPSRYVNGVLTER